MKNVFPLAAALLTAAAFGAPVQAQTNKPIPLDDVPRDGRPYNVINEDGGKPNKICQYQWLHTDPKGTMRQLVLQAAVMHYPSGESVKFILFNCAQRRSGGQTVYAGVMVARSLADVRKTLVDGRALLHKWQAGGASPKTETITRAPYPTVRILFHREKGKGLTYPAAVQTAMRSEVTSGKPVTAIYPFRTVAEYDDMVAKYDTLRAWLATR